MADLRIVDAPLLSTVKGTEKIPTGGEGNFSVSVNQVADFAKLKWFLATEGYVDNAIGNVQADLNLHKNSVSNPHGVTKVQVGLGNVDNTADLDKPVSNATQSAIITANSGKADKSYVDSQDQLKADKVTVEASLLLKADKSYVDSQDQLKADKTTVEASLLLKADKVDLTSSKIVSDGNQTQQSINDFGGAKWYAKSGGYSLNNRVMLDNGDIVKSTVADNTTNPNTDMTGWVKTNDASQINFKNTNVDTKLKELPTIADFKTQSGTWEDAFQSAIIQNNMSIDCGNREIVLSKALISNTAQNLTIRNAIIDCSNVPTSSPNRIIQFIGSANAATTLTTDLMTGSNILNLSSTLGLNKGDYVFLSSDLIAVSWDGKNATVSQWFKVEQVVSITQVKLDVDAIYDFKVSDLAKCEKVNPLTNIKLINVKLKGKQSGLQNAVYLNYCIDSTVDVDVKQIDYAGVEFDRCYNSTATGNYRDAQDPATSYGVVISKGCQNVRMVNAYGEDLRHLFTIGGTNGMNNYCGAYHNFAHNCRDAAIDSHPASYGFKAQGNMIECTRTEIQPKDGIISQGLHSDIRDNTIVGAYARSIVAEGYSKTGFKNTVTIQGNTSKLSGTASTGVTCGIDVRTRHEGEFESVSILGNTIDRGMEHAVRVFAEAASISGVSISSNPLLDGSTTSIYFLANTGFTITDFLVDGNMLRGNGSGVFLFGTGKNIKDGMICNNKGKNIGQYGLRMRDCEDISEIGNTFKSTSVKSKFIELSTDISVDNKRSDLRTIISSSSIITESDYMIAVNRPQGTHTTTLPDAAMFRNRELIVKNMQAQAINSTSSNVTQKDGTVSSTICAATIGDCAFLKSDGVNWIRYI